MKHEYSSREWIASEIAASNKYKKLKRERKIKNVILFILTILIVFFMVWLGLWQRRN